jgi:hypothetical protein
MNQLCFGFVVVRALVGNRRQARYGRDQAMNSRANTNAQLEIMTARQSLSEELYMYSYS